jgi:putative ABC transport system ATP-binding protein
MSDSEVPTTTTARAGEAAPAGRADSILLEVRGVTKTYRRGPEEVHALRDVTFDLRRHEVVALVGPSGSGKSTLLSVLCGWERPDSGELEWLDDMRADVPVADRPWSEVAILPQRLGLLEELSVRENVELPVRFGRAGRRRFMERADRLLSYLGLDTLADRVPSEISVGEQQRTALARAMILSPHLLLADEPTGHQDEEWGKAVFRALRAAANEGTACMVATHNPEVLSFAHRVLGIRDGRVTE